MTSTFSDRLKHVADQTRSSELIRENIDVSKSDDEIAKIRSARERRVSDLIQALRYASNPDDVSMMHNRINAVKMGLPEDANPTLVQETRERLFRKSDALLRDSDKV